MIELHGSANSMLGERFLKYQIPQAKHIKAGDKRIRAALNNIGKETKMRKDLQDIAHEVLNIDIDPHAPPEMPPEIVDKLVRLAQWVAILRGAVRKEKYTNLMSFKPTSEVPTRLAKQLAR